jgi:Zn-finger nucleic acid-binding protein
MKCPLCSVDLQMTERSGVEIDYCPKCRGVWLDRGELDKIVALSAPETAPTRERRRGDEDDFEPRYHERSDYDEGQRGHRKRRGSWLGDLFDFGD